MSRSTAARKGSTDSARDARRSAFCFFSHHATAFPRPDRASGKEVMLRGPVKKALPAPRGYEARDERFRDLEHEVNSVRRLQSCSTA
jgi:hypothetical protein